MKRLTASIFFSLIVVFVICPRSGFAQADASKTAQLSQEQVMRELLNEVRQLRQDMRRLSAQAYRAQALIERLRLQQDQVNRLTLELSKLRTQISELRSERIALNERVTMLEKQQANVDLEREIKAVKSMIEDLNHREQRLTDRETQLNAQLNTERVNLDELNQRFNEIEREMLSISQGQEGKSGKKEQ
ncbi:MAG TPA: hypothetical protein VEF04_17800 [Blastocatellia bacterium]|nr:hypothetical protein [Blastocatellia bacterium]